MLSLNGVFFIKKTPFFHHLVPFLTAIIVLIACLQQLEPLEQLDDYGNLCLVFEGQIKAWQAQKLSSSVISVTSITAKQAMVP